MERMKEQFFQENAKMLRSIQLLQSQKMDKAEGRLSEAFERNQMGNQQTESSVDH